MLEPTPHNLTLLFSIIGSGLYTLALYATRLWWLPWAARRPVRNAILLGVFNAAWIEAMFLILQGIFGATDVAASPNLLVDWLLTMPWYMGMVVIFVRVQARRHFSPAVVLLLGAVYEMGADGVVGGQIIPWLTGTPLNGLASLIFLVLLAFWEFILVYSSMVLPPAWVLEALPSAPSSSSAWWEALKPLLWLIPYTVYLLGVLLLMS